MGASPGDGPEPHVIHADTAGHIEGRHVGAHDAELVQRRVGDGTARQLRIPTHTAKRRGVR